MIIGNGCTIGKNVVIGDDTEIRNNVVIADGVTDRRHCFIKSNTVIGEKGFGFEYDENGAPFKSTSLGKCGNWRLCRNRKFHGCCCGTLKNTIIHDHVKVDNLVHIAHNCIIGENTMIIACAEVSGVLP